MTSIPYSEKSQLLDDETKASYDSVGPIIFCSHGKDQNRCCKNDANNGNEKPTRMSISWSHCHTDDNGHGVDKTARRRLIWASILCLAFMIIEIIGGFLANSLAIASDAAHLLTDFASFMISLFSLWMASRPVSIRMSFGWHRAEVVGALTSVLLIWVVTGILCYMAVQRIIYKTYEIDAEIMVITAGIGVVVNIIMGLSLSFGGVPHGHSHGGGGHKHSHSHEHDVEDHTQRGTKNINVRAALIHVIGDFFQSLGVLVAALIIYFLPDWGIVDPICTFLFSVIVLVVTFNIIKDVLNVLMEGKPRGVDFLEVQRTLFNINGVVKVHNLRIWSLSLDKTALSAHLAIAKGQNPTSVLNAASHQLRSQFNIYELTIQVEEYQDEMNDCHQCQTPES